MIKPLLRSVCLIALGIFLITPVIAANQDDISEARALQRGALRMRAFTPEQKKTYSQVNRKHIQEAVPITSKTYRTDLQNAIVLHNLMNSVQQQINQLESHRLIVLDKEISAARVKDFDECNERWLAPYFRNPSVVWSKLKEKTDALIDAYNQNTAIETEEKSSFKIANLLAGLDEASSVDEKGKAEKQKQAVKAEVKASNDIANLVASLEETGADFTEKGQAKQREQIKATIASYDRKDAQTTSAQEENTDVEDAMDDAPEIDISFAVLNSFYPDQDNKDKWGAVRKSTRTHSLPLWEDQKYLYNEKIWKPKYKAIVDICEKQKALTGDLIVLPIKEPRVSDEIKYDYYFYDQVQAAHASFINMVKARGCILPPESGLADAPESAPRPLPPVEEEIVVIKDSDVVDLGTQLYPQMPQNPKVNQNPKTKETAISFEEGTLWEAYKADKFNGVYEEGEFRTYFEIEGDGTVINDNPVIKTLPAVDELDGNRLSRYLLYKRDLQNAEMAYNNLIDDAAQLRDNIKEAILEANGSKVDSPELVDVKTKIMADSDIEKNLNINYLDKKDLTKLMAFLKQGKEKLLDRVESKIGPVNQLVEIKSSDKNKDCPLTQAEYEKLGNPTDPGYDAVFNKFQRCNEQTSANPSVDDLIAGEKDKGDNRSLEEDKAYVRALRIDANAEVLMTLEKALIIDEAIKEARANQALSDLFDKENNQNRLDELQGVVDKTTGQVKVKGKNYRADDKKLCLGQTKNRLVDINKVKIK